MPYHFDQSNQSRAHSPIPHGHPESPRSERGRRPVPPRVAAARARARARARRQRRITALLTLLTLAVLVGLCCFGISFLMRDGQEGPSPFGSTDGGAETPSGTQTEPPFSSVGDTASPPGTTPPQTLIPPDTDPPVVYPPEEKTVICIDPGHGYGDGGAQSDYLLPYYEKDINLAIALKVKAYLEADGYEVIMTRDSDTLPEDSWFDELLDPEERMDWLRRQRGVDYFVSIHCNSFAGSGRAWGTRLYYYTNNGKETPSLVQSVADGIFGRVGGKTPMINAYEASKAFTVIRHDICPALLIEVGFVTDEEDATKMKDAQWQDNMARGIANGLEAHVRAKEQDTQG